MDGVGPSLTRAINGSEKAMAGTVDVTTALREFAELLGAGADPQRCRDVLALLWRWQRDPDLDEASQAHLRALLRQYGRSY
jgi:hypothetical protein